MKGLRFAGGFFVLSTALPVFCALQATENGVDTVLDIELQIAI
jgi:hypothetical protein